MGSFINSRHEPQEAFSDISAHSCTLTEDDGVRIWKQRSSVPQSIDGCIHHLITEVARQQPSAPAVQAWDGQFSYAQLDALGSQLARELTRIDTDPRQVVPILFEKTKWTAVAMLGVIKSGNACVALDTTQPDARLLSIVRQIQPKIIISSRANQPRASALADVPLIPIDDAFFNSAKKATRQDVDLQLPTILPTDTAYISFTSGTTGTPKGACISHANVRSAVHHQGQKLGFTTQSRVFDFAPYSFDVAWSNFLHTLGAGGCICIAEHDDMVNDLSAAISAFSATMINVTPTVLRTIHPIPKTLDTVLLSGEMPFRENMVQWASRVRLLNTYGPTECTFKCAFSVLESNPQHRPDIGVGVGFCTWLVDPNDGNKLADLGSVGELCLEGPLVGQGYLSDQAMTDSAFVQDPPWLVTSHDQFVGRTGRLYKTGDLVRYIVGGKMVFVGRSDATQLKVRGQRVELGDVEHHVRACTADDLSVIADVVHPRGSKDPSLGLFVQTHGYEYAVVRSSINGLPERLSSVLPSFMIPTLFLPIERIPIASTGKTDRRRLRGWGDNLSWTEALELQSRLIAASEEYREPANEMEYRLRQIWASALNLDTTSLSTTSNFFQKGGDSVGAIFVVASARKLNLLLTVADIFRTPILGDLARITKPIHSPAPQASIAPFSMLKGKDDIKRVCLIAAKLCKVDVSEIEDVYPCTPLQEGMLAATVKNPGSYVSRRAFQLPNHVDEPRFQRAWNEVVFKTPILRTRIVSLPGDDIVQVVLKSSMIWSSFANIEAFLNGEEPMAPGKPLCRASVIQDNLGLFCLDIHHAIFDGWSIKIIMDAVEAIYHSEQPVELDFIPFQPFVKHLLTRNNQAAAHFWQHQLAGTEATVFPSPVYDARRKKDFQYKIPHLNWSQARVTPSSLIRSALAILLASYTNSNDVIFGATSSGRQTPILDIERIAGPTIATTPVRIKLDWHQTVEQLEKQIQDQAVEIAEHEQYGLQRIRQISPFLGAASEFQLLLVVQPVVRAEDHQGSGLFVKPVSLSNQGLIEGQADPMGIYNTYAMMIICQLEVDGLTLIINHDTGAILAQQVLRVARQLETLLQQLCSEKCSQLQLRELTLISEHDVSSVWEQNRKIPEPSLKPVVTSIDEHATNRPDSIAISAWDKTMCYRELKDWSCHLAYRLRQKGIGKGNIVLLSSEKSAWMAVAMVAILRTGAAALPLSAISSTYDARELMTTLRPKLALISGAPETSPFHGQLPMVRISELVQSLEKIDEASPEFPHIVEPSDPAVILFTSGSTGAAKGILWSHSTVSSNVNALSISFGLTRESRVFQFSDYEYDVSNIETFAALSIGACLCVPSGSDRVNHLAAAINHSAANWICLTPSVAENLSPKEVPCLKTMVCAGEMLREKTALKWMKGVGAFHNWYGPAEAAMATSYVVREMDWEPGFIGRGAHALIWLADPQNYDRLAPIGAIAEMCIEGPILAAGYVGKTDKALNEKAFVSPSWLERGHAGNPGRSGKIYKTGDLARYDAHGRLIIIGRSKDSERKLHGRRVDLSEIENRVQPALSGKIEATVVAEIFPPANSINEILAVFVKPAAMVESSAGQVETFVRESLPVDDIEETLSKTLPPYMIPKLYIPVANIPFTHAGKTDRRRLRQIGSSFTHGQLAKMQPSRREARKPSTEMEQRLQSLWAEVIGIEPEDIFSQDNFLQLGGDSIGAMRLAALAYDQGLLLSVADIFAFPRLDRMAHVIKEDSPLPEALMVAPLSLLRSGISPNDITLSAARLCHVSVSQIVDIYPCTPLQEGLLAMTARRSDQYISRSVLQLQESIDPERLRRAWRSTVDRLSILRTRIVDVPGQGLVQVVLRDWYWASGTNIESYVRKDEGEPMGLATQLCRAAIISQTFTLTIHHCLYDGNVLQMILDELEAQYTGKTGIAITPYPHFIRHIVNVDGEEAASFWRQELSKPGLSRFPTVTSPRYEPVANREIRQSIVLDWPRSEMTPSTFLRSAWAVLEAAYTSSDSVVYGSAISGRQVDMPGILNCVGPTISTVPIAITLDGEETVRELQARVQRQSLAMIPFEQYGLRNIQHATGRVHDPLFQTLLVVQPAAEGKSLNEDSLLFKARSFSSTIDTKSVDPFNTYPLMLICELSRSGLMLKMSYDDQILESSVARRIVHQLEKILRQMCDHHVTTRKVKEVQTASDADVEFFWSQNDVSPEEPMLCVPHVITQTAKERPSATAIDAHDGKFTYKEVEEFSGIMAQNLIALGLDRGSVIALCLDKSKWAPVAQLAIWKAGGICSLQPAQLIEQRPDSFFSSMDIRAALVFENSHVQIVKHHGIPVLTIQQIIDGKLDPQASGGRLATLRMSDPAALILSSGSTGEPKRILWSHRALAANVTAHAKAAFLNEASRLCQWMSHNFDACTIENFSTLARGGCLCIPSESQRLESLTSAIQRFQCNFLCLTPSAAKLLHPEDVSCLETLGFCGEKLVEEEVGRWRGKCRLFNWYGPAEASAATFAAPDDDAWYTGVIGRSSSSAASRCWLVDPRNSNNLAPWGAIGEIAIEGPACAECYLGNRVLTTQAFRNEPPFLSRRKTTSVTPRPLRVYLTGDLAICRPNGELEYVRRKDSMFKIRGNLVSPDPIEHHIQHCLSQHRNLDIVAEVITPKDISDPTLVAFLCLPIANEMPHLDMEDLSASLSEKLSLLLPRYAIPSFYIPIQSIPKTSTGKCDRKRLREIGATYEPPKQNYGRRQEPVTIAERTLREMWATILRIDADSISANDSFLQRGDSIQAMRLVGMARQQGLSLTVADIFQSPKLDQMAKCLKSQGRSTEETFNPFELLEEQSNVEHLRQRAASLCDVSPENIEDLFPCTPLQEGLLALTMKRQEAYVGRNVVKLSPAVDADRFTKAWEEVVSRTPILRTRIVDMPGQGLLQAVLEGKPCWTEAKSLEDYVDKECEQPFGLGSPLMRCGLFQDPSQKWCFALTMHHSIYDGVTTSLILETLESFYNCKTPLNLWPFQSFVKYISTQDKDKEARFWQGQFDSLEAPQFPALPSVTFQPNARSATTHTVAELEWRTDDFTPSTVVRAAWALTCSQYTGVPDVVFGTIAMGRKAAVAGIERLAGPTIAAVPIRVKINNRQACHHLLRSVQDQATETVQYEQTGLSKIARVSEEAEQACRFQTMLVVQPPEQGIGESPLFIPLTSPERRSSRYDDFNVYALMVVCNVGVDSLRLELSFDSRVIDHETLGHLAQHFGQILRRLCDQQDLAKSSVSQISSISELDLNQCWKWNSGNSPTNARCVHEIIAGTARRQPDSIAMSAWDGEVTYKQLDDLSSIIASHLVSIGVQRNMIVPICFEKSMWVPIAFLSVVKAGAAGLLLDPAVPTLRLERMLSLVQPRLILSSVANAELSSSLVTNTLIIGPEMDILHHWKEHTVPHAQQNLPVVDPTDMLYVIFTSGSTGTPKGCIIQHQNFSSAIEHQRTALKLDKCSRVYDFSSYAFDATYWSTFHTLAAGGTLCIPSDEERSSCTTKSIHDHRTTDMFLTPATARSLDPPKLRTLRNVYIGGEEVLEADVAPWLSCGKNVSIVYGPTECSAISLYWRLPETDSLPSRLPIGHGQGVSTWIVDPEGGTDLSPIGAVGELYLEGALVGQGYLGEDGPTASSFLTDPPWLLKGAPDGNVPGRRGKLYKTGDLVRYHPAGGTIIFVGRSDTQTKLRGQRIELSEVEHHIRRCAQVDVEDSLAAVAEIITPRVTGKPILVIFMQFKHATNESDRARITDQLNVKLPERLPSFMVPTAYIPIDEIPMSAGRKVDRKRLQAIGANMSIDQLMLQKASSKGGQPSTESEIRLQKLWQLVLDMPEDKIRIDSSFLHLGGDSIAAMRLASLARSQNMSLRVQQILSVPQLSEMAKTVGTLDPITVAAEKVVEPFSLLQRPEDKYTIVGQAAKQCGISVSDIEDVFPCTGIQKELLSMTEKRPGDCVATFNLKLKENVDFERLRQAWEQVSQLKAPLLRCRIVDGPTEDGLVYVQVNEALEWDSCHDVEEFLEKNSCRSIHLTQALTRLTMLEDNGDGRRSCLLTQHHAMYDGHSLNLLLQEVSLAYSHQLNQSAKSSISKAAPFQAFVKHLTTIDKAKANDFWRDQFSRIEAVPFPPLPHHGHQPNANSALRRTIDHLPLMSGSRDVTASTTIRAAWSILAAHHTGSDDVIFGALVTGRQAPIEGIESIIAPLIAALPIRVTLGPEEEIAAFLRRVHQQSIDMIAYEQTEFLDIRRINADTERATCFNTLLVVQPPGAMHGGAHVADAESPFAACKELKTSSSGLGNFNPHALLVMCQLSHTDNLDLELSFDSNVVDSAQVGRLAAQFEHILRQLCRSSCTHVEDIDMTSPQDLAELWKWNARLPDAVQTTVQDRIAESVHLRPAVQAICAWDGTLSYKQLDDLSDRLACDLIAIGAAKGMVIALCFAKSMWQPVAALGAIKAGVACVALDVQQPEERLRSITRQVGSELLLSSACKTELAGRISKGQVLTIDEKRFSEPYLNPMVDDHLSQQKHDPSDVLYILFTSGSTGVPKGIVMTNGAFSSAVTHQAGALLVGEESRLFDFVSYSFDITWSNLLNTLIRGACLCIPSEWERLNDFAGAFNRLQANYVHFPPSVASSLTPSALPGLKKLVIGGEPILTHEVSRWTQVENVLGIYGPAECAQGAVSIDPIDATSPNNHVGRSFGACFWLVQPGRPDRLAAIGAIGELLIEGPTLAREYLGDPDRTATAFIDAPKWLRRDESGHLGRASRLYQTGDLLRYNSDGTFTFIGRKDGMVKLRGQRIELSEIESHVRSNLHDPNMIDTLAAEMITPRDAESPIIVVFVSLVALKGASGASTPGRKAALRQALQGIDGRLSESLPRYMLPAAYLPLTAMPVTGTNKINRRALREMGSAQTTKMFAELQLHDEETTFHAPSTEMEMQMQTLWSSILRIEPSSINVGSNFFRLGGESIAAMRLIAAARQQHLSLTVADVFRSPRLGQLAHIVSHTAAGEEALQPQALLPPVMDKASFIRHSVLPLLDANFGKVGDVFPITAFQTQAVLDNLQVPPSRWHHWILDLPSGVDFSKLKGACEKLADHFDILRTVFIYTNNNFFQVQLEEFNPTFEYFDSGEEEITSFVDALCEQDLKRRRALGSSFLRFMAVEHCLGRHRLIIRISHAQFDGYCIGILLDSLSCLYSGGELTRQATFAQFMTFNKQREEKSLVYWTRKLKGCGLPQWSTSDPRSPPQSYALEDRLVSEITIPMPNSSRSGCFSVATIFHAACCVVLSRVFHQEEVVIGRLVTGRSMLPSQMQNVIGPCLSEIPIRINIQLHDTLLDVAKRLHQQFIEDSAYEGLGMDDTIQRCTNWPAEGTVKDFGWRTAFQQSDDDDGFEFLGQPSRMAAFDRKLLPRTRPEIYATPKGGELVISFEGNRKLISEEAVQEILHGLKSILVDF
ncbi:MAG: hypothetical protein Q9222_003085 [Ikaeria aurantiellina]